MTHSGLLALILAVAAATYLLRALPLALLRRPLRNPRAVASPFLMVFNVVEQNTNVDYTCNTN